MKSLKPLTKPEEIAQMVRHLLEGFYWLPNLKPNTRYERLHDDHDGERDGYLAVVIGEDGDAWVDPVEPNGNGLRFRMPLHGGGASPRVRAALVILAEAIRLDNEENPLQMALDRGARVAMDAMKQTANSLGLESPNDAFRWVCKACNTVNALDNKICTGCKKDKPE